MKSYKPFSGFCVVLIGIALSALGGGTICAQEADKVDPLCFRGKRIDHCKSFMIFEMGLKSLVTGRNRNPSKARFLLTGDIGWMKNTSMKNAFGFSVYGAADEYGSRIGIRPRFRRGLSRRTTLDFSAGIILSGTNYREPQEFPGFVASVSIGMAGWFSVDAHLEALKLKRTVFNPVDFTVSEEKTTDVSLYLGASGRHYIVLGALAFTFVAALIALIVPDSEIYR
ncbi:MAG: hypothetical protein IIB00_02645 [candidate division Zixibacteria bacterium]|nr:hypothetical protein [candidate division Zixibacteria bacterium]